MELRKETLRFERLVGTTQQQVHIEGEATLPGSMRDAVTVLSVQASAHLTGVQAGREEIAVRGHVSFQVLYTQGDLTRVRALETGCDFMHALPLSGVSPAMRVHASVAVQETDGVAQSGRMTLRATLGVSAEAFESVQREWITQISGNESLKSRVQTVKSCVSDALGEEKTLVREEFDLPAKLEVGEVLGASAVVLPGELSGGNGRIGVSGVIEVRVLHRPLETGKPLVTTEHELPFDVSIGASVPEGAQLTTEAEIIDVMADSVEGDKGRTLRVEAEVRVRLCAGVQQETTLLEDAYSLSSPVLEPVTETLDVHTQERTWDVRESTRLQVTLPKDAPPVGTMLAAFAQPMLAAVTPAGRRLDAEGVMSVTLIYLPIDSDIPVSIRTREPFMMAFPVEAGEQVQAQAYPIEATVGASTSDRAELRLLVGLRAREHGVRRVQGVQEITEYAAPEQEHGFVLVWPKQGETRWDTARRLRVSEDSLRPAGKHALVAFRR